MFLKKLTYTTWGFLALAVILMLVTNNNVGKQNEYDWSQQLERKGIENLGDHPAEPKIPK